MCVWSFVCSYYTSIDWPATAGQRRQEMVVPSCDGVSSTSHYWSNPQLISPEDIWLMLQTGLNQGCCCFLCYFSWWKSKYYWLRSLRLTVNSTKSVLIFSNIWLFQATMAHCCSEFRIKGRSCYGIQWLTLLSVHIVQLTYLCLSKSNQVKILVVCSCLFESLDLS